MARLPVPFIAGKQYGRLTTKREVTTNPKCRKIICVCSCGKEVEVMFANVRYGRTTSCGCFRIETVRATNLITHTTHGLTNNPFYNKWKNMHCRCYDKSTKDYHNYGGRGIKVWKGWHGDKGLKAFVAWAEETYIPGRQLDRRNNDKGYSPSNCRWVKAKKNIRNRSNTIRVEYKGKQIPLVRLLELKGNKVKYTTALARIQRGWNPAMAAT